MNKNLQDTLLMPNASMNDAIQYIEKNKTKIAIVVDNLNKIQGTITDGDVRRAILRGAKLDTPVQEIMNKHPTVAYLGESTDKIRQRMTGNAFLRHIPILDEQGRVVAIETLKDLLGSNKKNNWVILMAGGLGERLRPLTEKCPKPLLPIGNKPILETIVDSFVEKGFNRIFIAVNYKAEMVEDYLGDGSSRDIRISYLREDKKLGTAGPLSLLPETPTDPIIVMNADILTKIDFDHLLDFHNEHNASATMCVKDYIIEVPYGIVDVKNHSIVKFDEKPIHHYFINAGIYVLEPEVLKFVSNERMDMPSLFETVIENKYQTAVFPIREYWLDIGLIEDFHKANDEYHEVFTEEK